MEIRGRAPLRIYFAGDGTDLKLVYNLYGGKIINATIDKYIHGTIKKRKDKKIYINDIILKNCDDFTKQIIKTVKPKIGFNFWYSNDIPPGRGLGSSGTYSVLLIRLISELQGNVYDDYKIIDISYNAENESGLCGWQDQYAAAFGGFNFMEFEKYNKKIYPLRVKYATSRELEEHLILVYTKTERDSSKIQKQTQELLTKEKVERLKELSEKVKHSILNNEIRNIGLYMSESWAISKSKAISNKKLEKIHFLGIKSGAWGGKLLGAGGGGYMLFYIDPKKRNDFKEKINKKGYECVDFHFTLSGVETWKV